jgi:hypothetical protein
MAKQNFRGPVWYGIPDDFPQRQLEAECLRFLELLSEFPGKRLLTGGFTAVAYRYRAMADYDRDYQDTFQRRSLGGASASRLHSAASHHRGHCISSLTARACRWWARANGLP